MEALGFNVESGYLEGIVRGFKAALLTTQHYQNITQCNTLDDLKLQLNAIDSQLINEPSPLSTAAIQDAQRKALVSSFLYLRANANQPLAQFLDYITYSYMIDNVILLLTGTLHQRDTNELLDRCHPLGMFDSIGALCVATSVQELYHTVLVDSPIGTP